MASDLYDEWLAVGGDRSALWALTRVAQDAGALRGLDVSLGRFLGDCAPQAPDLAVWLAICCSAQLGHGHVCLDLQALCQDPLEALALSGPVPGPLQSMAQALQRHGLIACQAALDRSGFVGDGADDTGGEPLVRRDHRLYLARYWRAEHRVRLAIDARLAARAELDADPGRTRVWLDALFPASANPAVDWQKIACATASEHAFCIVAGGPGTGKTSTVVRLLALLQGLALERDASRGLRIRLAAPTGKAAARLNDSMASALADLRQSAPEFVQSALDSLPARAETLHRLLGSRPNTRHFRHTADHPLPADVVVIDEASMMDIEITDAILSALPPGARLILLGDKDQLASVEAGAVLGELCARAAQGHYTERHCQRLAALTGCEIPAQYRDAHGTALDQAIVMLRHSHRFQ
ncbi:MAG TPA: AAA family ATPase, partial [Castellaniella sp.]|nr:AAA family ATPase [Castellaniella sp.]